MAIISITVYANSGNEAENRSDANNGQSSARVSAFSHDVLQISRNIAAISSFPLSRVFLAHPPTLSSTV